MQEYQAAKDVQVNVDDDVLVTKDGAHSQRKPPEAKSRVEKVDRGQA